MRAYDASVARRLPALGAACIGAGFVVILVAWLGARDLAYVDQQFPALVAGGIAGLALIVLGAAALVVNDHRRTMERVADRVRDAILDPTRTPLEPEPADVSRPKPSPAPRPLVARPTVDEPKAKPDPAPPVATVADEAEEFVGTPADDDRVEPVAARTDPEPEDDRVRPAAPPTFGRPSGNGHAGAALVIPRRTLFHDPECRLVSARTDVAPVSRDDAVAAGLAACRICRP